VREDDVADVTQDVFVVVFRKLDGFEGRSSFRTWLYRICARTASDYHKRAYRRRERLPGTLPEPSVREVQVDEVTKRRIATAVQRALGRLSDEQRTVFVLYELEEMSMSEVALLMRCPLQTAFTRLYAARKSVNRALKSAGWAAGLLAVSLPARTVCAAEPAVRAAMASWHAAQGATNLAAIAAQSTVGVGAVSATGVASLAATTVLAVAMGMGSPTAGAVLVDDDVDPHEELLASHFETSPNATDAAQAAGFVVLAVRNGMTGRDAEAAPSDLPFADDVELEVDIAVEPMKVVYEPGLTYQPESPFAAQQAIVSEASLSVEASMRVDNTTLHWLSDRVARAHERRSGQAMGPSPLQKPPVVFH
jgi:RNA polymerase sigma-70 factor (ECF subfamily)